MSIDVKQSKLSTRHQESLSHAAAALELDERIRFLIPIRVSVFPWLAGIVHINKVKI